MTKKDYVKIADCIVNASRYAKLTETQISNIVLNFNSMLKADNERFDAQRFTKFVYDKLGIEV